MTTDITELSQSLKAAAEKLDAAQWQTRKGFSGIEVIVKGSLEKRHGFTLFQPVAADLADTKTARAIALFSPANILALVEALEKAQQNETQASEMAVQLSKRLTAAENRISELENYAEAEAVGADKAAEDSVYWMNRCKELESRTVTVKLPQAVSAGGQGYQEQVERILTAAGIKWEAE
ncbi:TPA: ead/Ea22-like family protein [Klebsiella aerogenes]|nr:ead/Ea22-like family protein [Klebsiella aerogenes]